MSSPCHMHINISLQEKWLCDIWLAKECSFLMFATVRVFQMSHGDQDFFFFYSQKFEKKNLAKICFYTPVVGIL